MSDAPGPMSRGPATDPGGDALPAGLEIAFRYLAKRDRTVAETRRRMAAGGLGEEEVDRTVGHLLEQGYLDDARYAVRFAEDRRRLDGWGPVRIAERLRAVGVASDLVDAAVAREHRDELEDALAVLRRRVAPGPLRRQERDRALGLLMRRGYDFELACDAVQVYSRERGAA